MANKKKVSIIIERSDTSYFGRVTYQDNLIVDNARTIGALVTKIKKLLNQFHHLDTDAIEFEYRYDLTAVFEAFNYLKISTVAEMSGINPSLLRQYSLGIKHPSEKQAKRIESTLHSIGRELIKASVFSS